MPHPSLPKKDLAILLLFFFFWRLGLQVVAWLAPSVLPYQPTFPYAYELLPQYHLPPTLYSWANFDGVHYLTVAERGYVGTGLVQAFFPVYPVLIALVNTVGNNSLVSGLIISHLSALLLLFLWYAFLRAQGYTRDAWFGVLALWLFPTSFFFVSVYSESLFLSLVLGSWLLLHRSKWRLAAVAAGIASGTRIVGIFQVLALLAEWSSAHVRSDSVMLRARQALRDKRVWLMGVLAGSGLLAYMWYLSLEFGDPLYFFHVQAEFGSGRQESLIIYPQVVWRYVKILWSYEPRDWKYFAYVQEATVGVAGMIGLIWTWFKMKKSLVLYGLGVFLLPTLTGTFSSLPRYALACFPLFLVLIELTKTRRWLRWFYLLGSTLLLILNTILFVNGYWVA